MNYEPKQVGKRAEKIGLALFFVAIVFVYMANVLVDEMRWIFQLSAILLLGIFIYIIVRWCFTNFKYEIKAKSRMETDRFADITADRLQFFVHRSQGKRGYAAEFLCDVGDIESIEPVADGEKHKGKKFVFYRNMKSENRYLMKVRGENETILVYLEIGQDGKDFLEFLKNKIA